MRNRVGAAAGLALALLLCQTLAIAAEPPEAERKLLAAFYELEIGTLPPQEARETCLLTLPATEVAEAMRQTASGFYGVSRSRSLALLCNAMVSATTTGSLLGSTMRVVFVDGDDAHIQGFEVGRFYRAVYFASQR